MTYIEELKAAIRRLHGVESKHVESVPVKEMFRGQTVWDGVVEVFDLVGHPKAPRAYAWAHKTNGERRYVAVLHMDAVTSPLLAVRAAILQEFREREPEAEA